MRSETTVRMAGVRNIQCNNFEEGHCNYRTG